MQSNVENKSQKRVLKCSGWMVCKRHVLSNWVYKTMEFSAPGCFVKNRLQRKAVFKIQNDDKYCIIWSLLVPIQPVQNTNTERPSNFNHSWVNYLLIDWIFIRFYFTLFGDFKCMNEEVNENNREI